MAGSKKYCITIVALFALLLVVVYLLPAPEPTQGDITTNETQTEIKRELSKEYENITWEKERKLFGVGGALISVEIADTQEARVQGLSGREFFPEDAGLLFIFEEEAKHGIWMKDMLLDIDIIWLDNSFTIVSIEEDVSPNTYPKVFTPKTPARYVLEVPAGFVQKHGINIGDGAIFFE